MCYCGYTEVEQIPKDEECTDRNTADPLRQHFSDALLGLPVGSDVVDTTRSELQDYPSATVYISHIQTHNFWNIFVSILSEYCDHYF